MKLQVVLPKIFTSELSIKSSHASTRPPKLECLCMCSALGHCGSHRFLYGEVIEFKLACEWGNSKFAF